MTQTKRGSMKPGRPAPRFRCRCEVRAAFEPQVLAIDSGPPGTGPDNGGRHNSGRQGQGQWEMKTGTLVLRAVAAALLVASLGGCEVARGMRDDLGRLTSSPAALQKSQPTRPQVAARPRPAAATTPSGEASTPFPEQSPSLVPPPAPPAPVSLAGKSEKELRALLGPPASEEERPPGKRWRYRDGSCSLEVQLYPDVQTKQFGTLAYEVKSDDNSDEGKRACLAQLQSRAQNR